MSDKNLRIWDRVSETDPQFTKDYKGDGGFQGTAVNALYVVREATKLFGPLGIGWGYNIITDRYDQGAPILAEKDGVRLPSGEHESIHTLLIRLWYMDGDKRGEVEAYGHTKMIYSNKWGIQTDGEPAKKSLTDAIKKALSMLGFSADIHLGQFDDESYVAQVATEFAIKNAEDQDAEIDQRKRDLTDYIQRNLEAMDKAVSVNEWKGVQKVSTRYLSRQAQIESLKAIADRGIAAISRKVEELQSKEKAA